MKHNKIIYGKKSIAENDIIYVNRNYFRGPPINYQDLTIYLNLKKQIEKLTIDDKPFLQLFGYNDISSTFPDVVIGLSDHSVGNYTCFAAIPYGASILEKHFTSDKTWPGPDIPVSIDPIQLHELIIGSKAIHDSLGGNKTILSDEQPTIDFAYACVVSIAEIKKGDVLSKDNIWVKRPGTGEIKAENFESILNKKANFDISRDTQIKWNMISD